jgi:nicotinamidase-related amidase
MLNAENTALILVDFQEKLMRAMHDKEPLLENAARLVAGAKILGLPILWSEQNPKGLGETVPELKDLLADYAPVTKLSFSCCGEPDFMKRLENLNRRQLLVAGIEAHVCVYQTVADLIANGYEVEVVADAVSSRTPANKAVGLEKCGKLGAGTTSAETALFELLRVAEGDRFKQMLKVVK